MFCPACRDEFRPGFTRCGNCDVDLVETLPAASRPVPRAEVPQTPPAPLVDFCGFLDLEEAQTARRHLREAGIRCEIVLRESSDAERDTANDEFWLRVDAGQAREAEALLEREIAAAPVEPVGVEADFECSACGHRVAASASACPKCGATFDED